LLCGAAEIPIVLSVYRSVCELFLNAATFDCEEAFATDFAFVLNFDLGAGFKVESLRVLANTQLLHILSYGVDMQFAVGPLLVHGAVLLVSLGCLSWSVLADAGFVLSLVGRLMLLEVLDTVVLRELTTTCSLRVDGERTRVSGVLLNHIRFAKNLYKCLVPSISVKPKVPRVRVSVIIFVTTASNRHSLTHA